MHGKYTRLMALLAVMVMIASSCGRTIYSKNYPNKRKFTHQKSNGNFWHKHKDRPRSHHGGGYW